MYKTPQSVNDWKGGQKKRIKKCKSVTNSAWPWIGDSAFIFHPAMVWSLFMSIRSIKNCTDLFHVIDTHRRSFKDRTDHKKNMLQKLKKLYATLKANFTLQMGNFIQILICWLYSKSWFSPGGGEHSIHHWISLISAREEKDILWNTHTDTRWTSF